MGVISSNVSFVCFLGWLVKEVVLLNQFLQLMRKKKETLWNYGYNNKLNASQLFTVCTAVTFITHFSKTALWQQSTHLQCFYNQALKPESELLYRSLALRKFTKNIKLGCPNKARWEENHMILWVNNYSHSYVHWELTDNDNTLKSDI